MSDTTPEKAAAKHESPETLIARVKPLFSKTGHLIPAFLDAYEKTENQSLASKEVGVGHDAVAAWKKNSDFMTLFTAAHLRAQKKNNDNLRASMLQRGINGNAHYVTDKKTGLPVRDEHGNPIVSYRDFETQLTIFLAKNRMPDEFRDKFEHEITGQILMTLTAEFSAILRKHVPAQFMPAITKELETMTAKLAGT